MQIKELEKIGDFALRVDSGEELFSALKRWVKDKGAQSASFQCIGAARSVELAFYSLQEKKYEDKVFSENMEIVSLHGNISWKDEDVMIHAHGVFGKSDHTCVSGHIKSLFVSATCEVFLSVYRNTLTRSFDDFTGLNLLQIN